jgi:hypothetical protein
MSGPMTHRVGAAGHAGPALTSHDESFRQMPRNSSSGAVVLLVAAAISLIEADSFREGRCRS